MLGWRGPDRRPARSSDACACCALRRHGVAPADLEIELTESTLMDTSERTLAPLRALKDLGVKLSIDDFGTGYSSLAYLHRFPIDMLKIDRSFVARMLDDPTHLAIVRAIVGLGHTLGLRVVAEGVESADVARALREARCDEESARGEECVRCGFGARFWRGWEFVSLVALLAVPLRLLLACSSFGGLCPFWVGGSRTGCASGYLAKWLENKLRILSTGSVYQIRGFVFFLL